jgi:mono/diheme cytochrome c family protein
MRDNSHMPQQRRFTLVTVWAAALTLSLVTVAGLRASTPDAPAPVVTLSIDQAKPLDPLPLYRQHCQMCHGVRGKAAIEEMAFFEGEWKHGTTSAQMATVITEGVKGTPMLAFKGKLSPEQIQALAKYVRSLDPKLPPEKQ